jgi:hypothetical protein
MPRSTPVPASHDKLSMELVNQVLGRREVYQMKDVFCCLVSVIANALLLRSVKI